MAKKNTAFDIAAFYRGESDNAYEYLGAHPEKRGGKEGYVFRVWAPNAQNVAVVGDFCDWEQGLPMARNMHGIWELFVPGCKQYDSYKYAVTGADGSVVYKSDPYGFHMETRPANASKLYPLSPFSWSDAAYQKARGKRAVYSSPLNIYEVHLASWRRRENGDVYDFRTLAHDLAKYVKEMGYNCVELMPVAEHPLDASWGYQCTGYFSVTSRFGTPHDFMYFVDHLHKNNISIILDWVPSHFCKDENGLYLFDGTCCYEYSDPKKQEHREWGTRVFDYSRYEVISFLLSSAAFWLREFHIDGLRVDAVASMLYLDYSRGPGDWTPNVNGGHENLEAIAFLQKLNAMAFSINPNALMVAEESTAWPLVTRPVDIGGLGFNLKWNMGWMNDICHYLKLDPWFRQFNHKDITFSMMYAFSENFVLPLSHDEVVHMKGSLINKMPGDKWLKLAGVRTFIAYMLSHPGKKLVFMGAEFGQWSEWNYEGQLDWALLDDEDHRMLHAFFKKINHFYLEEPALWEVDHDWRGFNWLVPDDNNNNVAVFARYDEAGNELVVAVNFSPNPITDYRFGVEPRYAKYKEIFSTNAKTFGGNGEYHNSPIKTEWIESHGKPASIRIKLPPMSTVFLRPEGVLAPPAKRGRKKAAVEADGTANTLSVSSSDDGKTAKAKIAKKTTDKTAKKTADKAAKKTAKAADKTAKKPSKTVDKAAKKTAKAVKESTAPIETTASAKPAPSAAKASADSKK